MFVRHCARSALRRALTSRAASTSEAVAAAPVVDDEFKKQWKTVAPILDVPSFASKFMKSRPEATGTIPEKLTLNLVLPHDVPYQGQEVDQVIVPATTGQMGLLPGHVPTVAQLKPGVLDILTGDEKQSYFVAGGFAFVHANSVADIAAVDAVELKDLDPEAVKAGLATYLQKLSTATTELETAEAQIGIEVHSAMSAALGV